MSTDEVRANYSTLGVEIMERIYSTDYLSIGGPASTEHLARLAGVEEGTRVLDIGCGTGGPALHLAETFGARVTGVDLMEHSIEIARRRATERDLAETTTFVVGRAEDLDVADGGFDVVWGQDAWCHVVDKHALTANAARALIGGGTIAFTDWLVAENRRDEAREAGVLAASVSPTMATRSEWIAILEHHGFQPVSVGDLSEQFAGHYRRVVAGMDEAADELRGRYGDRVVDTVSAINHRILDGFDAGLIGGASFVATRRQVLH